MEDLFVFNIWGIILILSGPMLYTVLRIAKVDQNIIGFFFGIFIFLFPVVGFFMMLSQKMYKIVSVMLILIFGGMYLLMYFIEKRSKTADDKKETIDENIK